MKFNKVTVLILALSFAFFSCQKESPASVENLQNEASASEKFVSSGENGIAREAELSEEHFEQISNILEKLKTKAEEDYNIVADIAFQNNAFYLAKESLSKHHKNLDEENLERLSGDRENFEQRRKEYKKSIRKYNSKEKKQAVVVVKRFGPMDFELIRCTNNDSQCMADAIMESLKVKAKNCIDDRCNKIEVNLTYIPVDQ